MSNNQSLFLLKNAYVYYKVLYSMSFIDRLQLKLGFIKISFSINEKVDKMDVKELEEAIKKLKKPWWDFLFF